MGLHASYIINFQIHGEIVAYEAGTISLRPPRGRPGLPEATRGGRARIQTQKMGNFTLRKSVMPNPPH